jgi:hypothetical protein
VASAFANVTDAKIASAAIMCLFALIIFVLRALFYKCRCKLIALDEHFTANEGTVCLAEGTAKSAHPGPVSKQRVMATKGRRECEILLLFPCIVQRGMRLRC